MKRLSAQSQRRPNRPQRPRPQRRPSQQKDALAQFVEAIETYPTAAAAKKDFQKIADRLGCSKQLGYKALRKVTKFADKSKTEYREAAVKMRPSEEIQFEKSTEPAETTLTETTPQFPVEPSLTNLDGDNYKEDLQPIIEHGTAGAVRNILKAVSTKIGDGKGKDYMTSQREKDLGVLLPYVVGKMTNKATLTRDDYINYATLALCGDIATELIADKLNKPKEKPDFKETEPENPAPTETPPTARRQKKNQKPPSLMTQTTRTHGSQPL